MTDDYVWHVHPVCHPGVQPAGAPAPVIVEHLLPVVRGFAQRDSIAFLLVGQHVHLALEVADRGYVLSRGGLAASGSAADLSRDSALLAVSYLGGQPG